MPNDRDLETRREGQDSERLPGTLGPMMLAHLALTGDQAQQVQWRNRLEAIRQADAIDNAPDPETKAILANKRAWKQMRNTGRLGASFGLGVSSLWFAWLIPTYAVGWGFGWWTTLFLLPIPLAWRAGRWLWERASLEGMRDLGERPSLRKRYLSVFRSMLRAFNAGFGFGFVLVFLTALITWFMTPADTLAAELLIDAWDGTRAGMVSGFMSMMLAPLVGRGIPPGQLAPQRKLGVGAALSSLDED